MSDRIVKEERTARAWDAAEKWEAAATENAPEQITWKFDCNFKLDCDGPLVRISSRFYPHRFQRLEDGKWEGTVDLYFRDEMLCSREFEAMPLDQLKIAVETHINEIALRVQSAMQKEFKTEIEDTKYRESLRDAE